MELLNEPLAQPFIRLGFADFPTPSRLRPPPRSTGHCLAAGFQHARAMSLPDTPPVPIASMQVLPFMARLTTAGLLISLLAMLPACARQPAADTAVRGEGGPVIARSEASLPRDASGEARVQAGPELEAVLEGARSIVLLKAVAVSQSGRIVGTRGFRGSTEDSPTNIRSASKTVLSALVGVAIDKGVLQGTVPRVADVLEGELPANPDPRLRRERPGRPATDIVQPSVNSRSHWRCVDRLKPPPQELAHR
jgi:hypothetical protein